MSRAFLKAMGLSALVILTGTAIGCGGDEEPEKLPDIETLFPADAAVGTWAEDTSKGAAGVETATTNSEVYGLIDGSAAPFVSHNFVAFARQYYTDGTYTLELRVWQMRSKADAKEIYEALPTDDALYDQTWTTIVLGEEGRVADTGSTLWINTHQNAYHIEAGSIIPNDSGAQTAATPLVKAVLAEIP